MGTGGGSRKRLPLTQEGPRLLLLQPPIRLDGPPARKKHTDPIQDVPYALTLPSRRQLRTQGLKEWGQVRTLQKRWDRGDYDGPLPKLLQF